MAHFLRGLRLQGDQTDVMGGNSSAHGLPQQRSLPAVLCPCKELAIYFKPETTLKKESTTTLCTDRLANWGDRYINAAPLLTPY